MQIRLIYMNNESKAIDAIVGVGDKAVVLVGTVKKHPQPGVIFEVVDVNKARIKMTNGNVLPFNKNRISLPRYKEVVYC